MEIQNIPDCYGITRFDDTKRAYEKSKNKKTNHTKNSNTPKNLAIIRAVTMAVLRIF